MKKILCFILLFFTFFSFNYVNASNQETVDNIMNSFYVKLDNSSLDINKKISILEKISNKIISIKSTNYDNLTKNSQELLNLLELNIYNKIQLYNKKLNLNKQELNIQDLLNINISNSNNNISNNTENITTNNYKKKTILDCTNKIQWIYWTVDWSDRWLTCNDDIIICTWNWIWITIASCNAWATEVYNNQKFLWFSNDRTDYINSWAWGLYLWWNNTNFALPWVIPKYTFDSKLPKIWSDTRSICNAWYHIPTDNELLNLFSIAWFKRVGEKVLFDSQSRKIKKDFFKKLKFPFAGSRSIDLWYGNGNWNFKEQGNEVAYWASTNKGNGIDSYIFLWSEWYRYITYGDSRAQAASVRCFKD